MLRIAHRGASGEAPENTLKAIEMALEMGVEGIEVDVRLSADGTPVIIHDPTLDRTTDGSGQVSAKTLAELMQLNAGEGEQIPTLKEAIQAVAGKALLFIELKEPELVVPVEALLREAVRTEGRDYREFPVISFHHPLLEEMKRLNPKVFTGANLRALPVDLAACGQRAGAQAVNIAKEYVTPEFVADARARSLLVYVYTVNEAEAIERVKALGVDGIMSDYPERLQMLRFARGSDHREHDDKSVGR